MAITKGIPIITVASRFAPLHVSLQPTRRQVLGGLTTAGLVLAASGLPLGSLVKAIADDNQPPPRGPAQATLFDFKKVADGIYGAIAKPTAMLNCNAAVIVNRDHVLVVDTHSKPSAAKALIRQYGTRSPSSPSAMWSTATFTVTTPWATKPTPKFSAAAWR